MGTKKATFCAKWRPSLYFIGFNSPRMNDQRKMEALLILYCSHQSKRLLLYDRVIMRSTLYTTVACNNIFCWLKEVTLIHWEPVKYQTLTHGMVYPIYLIIPPDNIPNNKVISLSCYLSGCKNPVPS